MVSIIIISIIAQAPKAIHELCAYEACHCNDGCVADLLEYIMSGKAEKTVRLKTIARGDKK